MDNQTTDIIASLLKHWIYYKAQLITYDMITQKFAYLLDARTVWHVKSRF